MNSIMQSIDNFLISVPHGYIVGFLVLVIALCILGNISLIKTTIRQIKTEFRREDKEATIDDNKLDFHIYDSEGKIQKLGQEIRKEIRERRG